MIAGLPKNIFLRYITRLVMVITLSTFFVSLGWARTIYVDINGGADFIKIQEAIEAADYDDTIQVAAGIYNENIRMKDEVDLIGEGAGVTFIKGSNNEVVRGAQHCTISGFTIANPLNSGGYSDFSHGINCYYVPDHGSSMVIKNNIIKDHYVGIGYTNALIINNVIINNRHSGIGLGNPVIKNNILMENGYGSHGAIYMNNTINGANGFNTSGWHISYNDVWNNNPDYSHDACAGIGDISEDPLFVDKANGDYHLQTESLCIDTGDPSILDEDGSRSDIGAFPFTGERISPDQFPPTVSISISPETVTIGDSIEVTVTGTDDKDLLAIWWWGENTGDTELDKAHWHSCSGTSAAHTWIISTSNLPPRTYTLGANARDKAYPTPGEVHQASEGDGIAYANFVVLERKPDLRIIDFSWSPESPVAGQDFDFDLLIYFKCEGERDIFLDVNQNGTYDSGIDVWNGAYQVQDSFNVTLKINGKPFKNVILTYNPILAGTGWRIKFGESGGSERFTNEFYRACVKGENEIYVKVDSNDEIAETDENNNELTKKIYVYDIIPPELVIINPKDNDKIKDIITVLAEATDNVAVAKVEFYVDSSQVHIDTNPPYEWEWQTYSVENGEHIIKVVAYDTFGNTTASSVKVQVENEIARAWIEVPKEGKRIKGNAVTVIAGATRSTAKVLFQYRKKWTQSEPEIVNEMTMSCDGKVKVTLIKASAGLVSDIFLASPEEKLLIEDNLTNVGTIIEEEYKAGTKLNFFIRTYGDSWGLGTYDHYATAEGSSYNGTTYCLIQRLSLTTWELSFEDLPGDSADWDYDDVVLLVEVIPSNEYEDGLNSPWVDITLDSKRPYACYWNVSGVDNGGYGLRAIAYDKYGCPDSNPTSITVIVDDVNWDIHENGNPEVDPNKPHRKCERFYKDEGATIALADGTQAIIPPGIDISAEIIEITILNPEDLSNSLPPEESSLKSIGVFREYKFSDGSKIFNKEITLILPYPNENGDGIVDGTEVEAKSLKPYWLDEEKESWIPVGESSVHSAYSSKFQQEIGNFVKVNVNHFTVFSLMGTSPKMDFKNVIVYPNPYKPNSGLGHTHICFDGLTEEAIVTIYTITGRLVDEITEHKIPGKIEWNVLNSNDEKVASGVYLYIVTDGKNKPSKGKFAIIR